MRSHWRSSSLLGRSRDLDSGPQPPRLTASHPTVQVSEKRNTRGLFYLRSVLVSAPKKRSTAVLFVSMPSCRFLSVAPKRRANRCSAFGIYLHCFQSISCFFSHFLIRNSLSVTQNYVNIACDWSEIWAATVICKEKCHLPRKK